MPLKSTICFFYLHFFLLFLQCSCRTHVPFFFLHVLCESLPMETEMFLGRQQAFLKDCLYGRSYVALSQLDYI